MFTKKLKEKENKKIYLLCQDCLKNSDLFSKHLKEIKYYVDQNLKSPIINCLIHLFK